MSGPTPVSPTPVSPTPGPSPEDDARAAEYVLGTLSALEARAAAADPALAGPIAEWERRLGPLTRLAPAEAPPPGLWARIEAQIAPPPPPQRTSPSWRTRLLRAWATGATLAAAAMALLVLARPTPTPTPTPMMTVMLADRTQPAWTAQVGTDGAIRLAAITPAAGTAPPPTPADRVQQLWVLPPGATTPTSLALLPRDSRAITLPAPAVRPVPGMLIEITLEPQGGSPTGRPTGPVQFIGRLSAPGPDT